VGMSSGPGSCPRRRGHATQSLTPRGKVRRSKFKFRRFGGVPRAVRRVKIPPANRFGGGAGPGKPWPNRGLPRPAEKFGELRNPGFELGQLPKDPRGFLLVTEPSQGRQHVGERRFFLLRVPGAEGKTDELMARLMKPHHHDTVDE